MKTHIHFLTLCLLALPQISSSQSFQITPPRLEFDGSKLLITYDIINNSQADLFYVWVEMETKNGEPIQFNTLSGDVGEHVKAGRNRQITWLPEKDTELHNEEVFVEIKAEKYVKSFNKGSAILMSTAIPGLGQTKISKGKPWWITGVVSYGLIAGGLIVHNNSLTTYDSYNIEEDPVTRADLFEKSVQQLSLSNALISSGAVLWAVNILWVAITPTRYQSLQHVKLTLDKSTGPYKGSLLSIKLNF